MLIGGGGGIRFRVARNSLKGKTSDLKLGKLSIRIVGILNMI